MPAVRIETSIPGPQSIALAERRKRVVSNGQGSVTPVYIKKAKDALLTDVDGNTFIDFAGGIGVMNVGHGNPNVLEAVKNQADDNIHTCFTVAPYESYIQLAEKLTNLAPGFSQKKAAFFNSGAEAVENAVKIAKAYTGRTGVIVFENGFHGRTQMTMSMTSRVDPYKKGYEPFVPEIYRLPFPDGRQEIDFARYGVTYFDPDTIACAVLEPVAGEGGFIPADRQLVEKLAEFCQSHGILLVMDEVQTGFARTGKMFASEYFSIEPDLITVAKSMAAGMPLSGVIGKSEIMDSVRPGGIGGTYCGNPVACAAALAVLKVIEEENLCDRANSIGEKVLVALEGLKQESPWIKEVRGRGAMIGIEIWNPDTGDPDKDRTAHIAEYALNHGLVTIGAGSYANVIRTLMPLTISDDVLQEGITILTESIKHG